MTFSRKCECIKFCEFHRNLLNSWKCASEKRRFNRNPLLWSFICSFDVWVIWKKVILARWNLACMKTGFWLNGNFLFIYLTPRWNGFFYTIKTIHMRKPMPTNSIFRKVALDTFFWKQNSKGNKVANCWRKTIIYLDK